MKKTDLLSVASISSPTLAKLTKGETVTTEIIEKICNALNVQPGDIMEYIPDNGKTLIAPAVDDITIEQLAEITKRQQERLSQA
jgi:DNA-binding Xre family transcriptional regulator